MLSEPHQNTRAVSCCLHCHLWACSDSLQSVSEAQSAAAAVGGVFQGPLYFRGSWIIPVCSSFISLALSSVLTFSPNLLWYRKRPWGWEWLKAGGKGGYRGWDGWMASPIRWTWVSVSSGSWWWKLQSMGWKRFRTEPLDWTELNWTKV